MRRNANSRILAALLAAALLICALSACGTDAPAPESPSAAPSAAPEATPEATPDPTPSPAPAITSANLFESLPELFLYTEAGASWHTELYIAGDGSFRGRYIDTDAAEPFSEEAKYSSYNTVCDFEGRFEILSQEGDHEFLLGIAELYCGKPAGTIEIDEETNAAYIYGTVPRGLDGTNELRLYVPGRATADLPEEFSAWICSAAGAASLGDTLELWALRNVNTDEGFAGLDGEPA